MRNKTSCSIALRDAHYKNMMSKQNKEKNIYENYHGI